MLGVIKRVSELFSVRLCATSFFFSAALDLEFRQQKGLLKKEGVVQFFYFFLLEF